MAFQIEIIQLLEAVVRGGGSSRVMKHTREVGKDPVGHSALGKDRMDLEILSQAGKTLARVVELVVMMVPVVGHNLEV